MELEAKFEAERRRDRPTHNDQGSNSPTRQPPLPTQQPVGAAAKRGLFDPPSPAPHQPQPQSQPQSQPRNATTPQPPLPISRPSLPPSQPVRTPTMAPHVSMGSVHTQPDHFMSPVTRIPGKKITHAVPHRLLQLVLYFAGPLLHCSQTLLP